MNIYKTVLFQLALDSKSPSSNSASHQLSLDSSSSASHQIHLQNYLGTFTYDFFKYSYFEYTQKEKNEGKKAKEKKECNQALTKYISFFLKPFLEDQKYAIYFIAEIQENDSNIIFDKRLQIECILSEKDQIFSFLTYKIDKSNFMKVQDDIHKKIGLSDYRDVEKPFLDHIERKPEVKKSVPYRRKTVRRSLDSDSDESEYEYDEDEEKKIKLECKKYQDSEECYSVKFQKTCYEDADQKYSFWSEMCNKFEDNKSDKKIHQYCRLRQATQYIRRFMYEPKYYNLFRLRHLFVVTYLDIDNEEYINTDFDNNDDIEITIKFELMSTCGKYKSSASICKSGCYENGGFSTQCDIDYVENDGGVEKRALKELYMGLFNRYNPYDI
jgi:hypothetical protein